MNEKQNDSIKKFQHSLEDVLKAKTTLKQKPKTKANKSQENFEELINTLEELDIRSFFLEEELEIDLSKYEDKFYNVIDILLEMNFGTQVTELIMFYIYKRVNPDGSINSLLDQEKRVIPLESPSDLWNLVQIIKNKKPK